MTTIWWIRRDLRLHDNEALTAAMTAGAPVVPLFILDPALLQSAYVGEKRLTYLFASLRQLDADLRRRGSRLILRQGPPMAVLRQILAETGATAIRAQADVSPYARRRDTAVSAALPLHLHGGFVVRPPGSVMTQADAPYTVFTPFSKTWRSLPGPDADRLLPTPMRIPTPPYLSGLPVPADPAPPTNPLFPPGEAEARRRLASFVAGDLRAYDRRRHDLDTTGTSRLSPYLRFGQLSPRLAVVTAVAAMEQAPDVAARKGAETWLSELIWREFYAHVLYHFPHARRRSFRPQYDNIAWNEDAATFAAWCAGETGYPVVDAAMRQLAETGWMHNRARMITASFLVKDLLIDWRKGEQWFMRHLLDGDPAANNGGWQWSAGTGTDAAPYFRIFNPTTQGQKFDPRGDFVRRWLPELALVPDRYIHTPWEMPPALQQATHCRIGREYPAPIVDHQLARQRTLAAFDAAKAVD
ncbi:MAG: deoxyribodipyrimidine photo-lyase [Anaerolineales bacterium]|nr:deoxyribodipyrimidine photo-lyase [Anaerolineales bacterium]MCB8953710.1 deoxyribodipyrimidine photo-lyase [Ardenticatenales bacterium]